MRTASDGELGVRRGAAGLDPPTEDEDEELVIALGKKEEKNHLFAFTPLMKWMILQTVTSSKYIHVNKHIPRATSNQTRKIRHATPFELLLPVCSGFAIFFSAVCLCSRWDSFIPYRFRGLISREIFLETNYFVCEAHNNDITRIPPQTA